MRILIPLLLLSLVLSCVQDTYDKIIYFKLDMTNVENVSEVGIRGEFTNPSWQSTVHFKDDNDDGIFEGSITKNTAQNAMNFKFVYQDSIFELKDQNNRVIHFTYQPETILYESVFDDLKGTQSTIK